MSTHLDDRFCVVPAVYILFRQDDTVLLLRRANTGYYDGQYSLPAGHIDGHESALTAAIREAKEEVGANLTVDELSLVHTMHRVSEHPRYHERIDLYFETTKSHPEITNCEPDKCDELRWVPITALPDSMVPEVKQALLMRVAAQPYSDFAFDAMS
ncbi:MAG TPA: NUDIX domain-containing protein [Candidatus Saccharimonadales bacterium]|nr:NUDIX domain-containing protein [Candidatus Saccharimonadales bacterium]